jgi:GT2 family glycosyltransferase
MGVTIVAAGEGEMTQARVVAPALALVVDLDEEVPAIPATAHASALVLARRHRRPLGEVVIPLGPGGLCAAGVQAVIEAVLRDTAPPSAPPAASEGGTADLPPLSVVVTTCGNPEGLVRCVDSILASSGCRPSVIVVDNRPHIPSTRLAVEEHYADDARVTLVSEARQGLSRARNTGIRAADTELVAWTDDDVVVDRYWARSLVEAFDATAGVDLVTGLVRPLELETQAQVWREVYRGYSNGFARRVWRTCEPPVDAPLFPYATGRIGTGANMAARRGAFELLGGFDPDLGAGTPSAGGEDLDLIFRFLEEGSTVVYEPAAIICHAHHAGFEDLVDQARSYGTGLASYLMKLLLSDPHRLAAILRRAPAAVVHLRTLRRGPRDQSARAPEVAPAVARRIRRAESVGLIAGVAGDLRRRAGRRVGRQVGRRVGRRVEARLPAVR